jgi:S1-C subfamily serine protease
MGPRTHTERTELVKARRMLVGVLMVTMWIVAVFTLLAKTANGQAVGGWVSAQPSLQSVGNVWLTAESSAAKFVSFAQCPGPFCPNGTQVEIAEPWAPTGPQLIPRPAEQAPPWMVRVRMDEGNGTSSLGSGAIVETTASWSLVVTAGHVVRDGGRAFVVLPDGRNFPGEVLAQANDCDAAIIRVMTGNLPTVPVDTADPTTGVLIVGGYGGTGQPLRSAGQLRGWTAGQSRSFVVGTGVRQGDSGGPVVNERGVMVGVLWGCAEGETYCTPIAQVRNFARRLLGRDLCCPPAGPIAAPPAAQPPVTQPPILPPADAELEARVAALESQLAKLKNNPGPVGPIGPPGLPGKDGKDGEDATVDLNMLAVKVSALIATAPPTQQPPPTQPPPTPPQAEADVLYFTSTKGCSDCAPVTARIEQLKAQGAPITIIDLDPTQTTIKGVPRLYFPATKREIVGLANCQTYLSLLAPL